MIEGHVDEAGHPLIEIKVAGNRAETQVVALLDNGFDGDLSLPLGIAIALGLELDSSLMEGQVVHLDFRENRVSIE